MHVCQMFALPFCKWAAFHWTESVLNPVLRKVNWSFQTPVTVGFTRYHALQLFGHNCIKEIKQFFFSVM